LLKEIKDYLKRNNDINNIIIAGDMNQNIALNEIQQFFQTIGVTHMHHKIN